MAAWSRHSGHCFVRRPSPDDLHQFESELGLQDILTSLERLRQRYSPAEGPAAGCVGGDRVAQAGAARQEDAGTGAASSAASAAAACGTGSTGEGHDGGTVRSTCASSSAAASSWTNAGGSGVSGSYDVRQYLQGQMSSWLGGLGLGCLLGDLGGGGGSNAGCGAGPDSSAEGCARSSGGSSCGGISTGAGDRQQEPADAEPCAQRRDSGAAAGASPRCGAAGDGARSRSTSSGRVDPWATGLGWGLAGGQQPRRCQAHAPPQQPQGQPQDVHSGEPAGAGKGGGLGGASALGTGLWEVRQEWLRQAAERAGEDPDAVMGRNLLWLAELLNIWRPVLYVSLLKRYGRRSWRPWLLSLSADLLSAYFHRRGRQHLAQAEERAAAARAAAAHAAAAPGADGGEERELYERRKKLLLYGLRSPFLEATTLAVLSRLRSATSRVPLLGFGTDYLYGMVEMLTAYYTYTSGSN
ncbi:hypothetical protein GPECTOR_4g909 [Gonium pectorale]|uniref:Peroxisomal membrane protein PEX16 n=1 Tax=Gonium pectorale TaxID=33097 RepID=A0A150GY61_GONPE|nr:hypothetical protein GPECTOR_4g909 [Gonium pectorale]|eukprot:KXZ54837.1 hypothetical protein GPECTOR_4g909 [Gonium pectorale]